MDFNDFWYKYSWYNWPSNGSLSSHLTQCLFLHYLGKQNKRNMHWNEQQTSTNWILDRIKIWSRWSELMKCIVYLLTVVLPAIKRVAGDTFVFQQYSAPAHRLAKRSNCCSAEPQTSSLRICGPNSSDLNRVNCKLWGSCNSGSIRGRSRMRMNSRSNRLKSGLVWAEHYWHCYQQMEKRSVCLCSHEEPTFQTFTVGSWTTGQLDKLSARVTEM